MRGVLAMVGLLSMSLSLASCGASRGRAAAAGDSPRRGLAMIGGQPSCGFRVIAQLSGRFGDGAQSPGNSVQAKARAMGADAVMDYRGSPQFDANGRQVATNWTAVAIAYTNRDDPNCYR